MLQFTLMLLVESDGIEPINKYGMLTTIFYKQHGECEERYFRYTQQTMLSMHRLPNHFQLSPSYPPPSPYALWLSWPSLFGLLPALALSYLLFVVFA